MRLAGGVRFALGCEGEVNRTRTKADARTGQPESAPTLIVSNYSLVVAPKATGS